jgi:glycosyltransferase involved in cell wall biosynthesis
MQKVRRLGPAAQDLDQPSTDSLESRASASFTFHTSLAARLWIRAGAESGFKASVALDNTDPELPEWIENIWIWHGRPEAKGSGAYGPKGRALLWFVSYWCSRRKPYRFVLSKPLLDWLNATDLDFTDLIQFRPTLDGAAPSSALKPISRLMRSVWEERNRKPVLAGIDGYFEFIAHFALAILPESNAPAGLLPQALVDLLNTPASTKEVPLTVGMLLYLKRTCASEYQQLVNGPRDYMLALCFQAAEVFLAADPRLVPTWVSQFWNRSVMGTSVTAFEYLYSRCGNTSATARATQPQPNHALLYSRPLVVERPAGSDPLARIQDDAILIYRDHVTVAGLSRAGAAMKSAFEGAGLPTFDLHFSFARECETEARQNRQLWINSRRKVHILNLNPEYVPECIYSNLSRFDVYDYAIGHFFWELSQISRAHEPGLAMMDEIWTASSFLTKLYEATTKKPVITMGLVIPVKDASTTITPEYFGYARDTFLFLSSFDAGSIVERKNPLGAIIAFQLAFPRGTERVGLIIKTRNLDRLQTPTDQSHWTKASERIGRDQRIRLVQETMSEDELTALYRLSACFVSLHRSEGFGLGLAEAMAQGKPVIATDYSGVCDFCTTETAKLVNYELIRANQGEYPYLDPDRVYEWANPDLKVAAGHMRALAEDREQGERLGHAGRNLILKKYSIEALGNRYTRRLEQLGLKIDKRMKADSAHAN